jgi:hypothetical protein
MRIYLELSKLKATPTDEDVDQQDRNVGVDGGQVVIDERQF